MRHRNARTLASVVWQRDGSLPSKATYEGVMRLPWSLAMISTWIAANRALHGDIGKLRERARKAEYAGRTCARAKAPTVPPPFTPPPLSFETSLTLYKKISHLAVFVHANARVGSAKVDTDRRVHLLLLAPLLFFGGARNPPQHLQSTAQGAAARGVSAGATPLTLGARLARAHSMHPPRRRQPLGTCRDHACVLGAQTAAPGQGPFVTNAGADASGASLSANTKTIRLVGSGAPVAGGAGGAREAGMRRDASAPGRRGGRTRGASGPGSSPYAIRRPLLVLLCQGQVHF